MKFLAITALTAGLFMGSAALAQGISQSETVSYALTLIDAGPDGTDNSATGGAITDATKTVRVKVTVSVPRAAGSSNYGGIINSANPVRLMYRKHRGPATAFNGSISLLRDAPYAYDAAATDTDGYGSSNRTAYYPMPQKDAAGKPIRDPKALNYFAVKSGDTLNAEGVAYTDYVCDGRSHDPERWEATYLSPAYAVDWANLEALEATSPMIHSLLTGSGTYEWYASSRYGMGSFTRISPIQDIARAMDFTDIRLWTPLATDASNADINNEVDNESMMTLGHTFEWRVNAMPEVLDSPSWHIYRGSVGSNGMGSVGAQLLNVTGSDNLTYTDYARIESPTYPDGIGSIEFNANSSSQDVDANQELLVQYTTDGTWKDLTTVEVTQEDKSYTVDFNGMANAETARFRLVRKTVLASAGSANALTLIVHKLRVRSAKPVAIFDKPTFTPNFPAYNTYDADGNLIVEPFSVNFEVKGGGGVSVPRGYAATLNLRRRAEGDNTRSWKTADVAVDHFTESTGNATLKSTFTRGTLVTNVDGSVNADEGAFFLRSGKVIGLLPGVYDLALDYHVYGSFKAGRDVIDEHETIDGVVSTYEVTVEDADNNTIVQNRPNVLDLREHDTAHEGVYLRVMYRSGTIDDEAPYTLKTMDVPLLPSSREPHLWRVDLPSVLKLEDETAVYAWGYDPPGDDTAPTFVLNKLAFTIYAITSEGTMWYGQRAATSLGTIPPVTDVVPAFTETIRVGAEADVVPMVLNLEELATSHVMIELDFPADPSLDNEASIRVAGSYWQDFNTWHATSDSFTKTEFRENLRSRVADFDCKVEEHEGETSVVGGWIPDEGPLAATTSFTETFEVGRQGIDNYPFFMHNLAVQAEDYFASWGASSVRAEPKYMRVDEDTTNFKAKYMTFGQNAEIVLNRSYHRQSTDYLPDAQIRLRGQSFISPLAEGAGGVALNGVGTVSFNLGISLPYDFSHRAQLISTDRNDMFALNGYGVGGSVTIPSSTTCATSGYSVSYYLDDMAYGNVAYELRLTQILNFSDENSTQPSTSVVAELYKWSKTGAVRLPLVETDNKTSILGSYKILNASLSGNSYGLWVRSDGKLAVGFNSGNTLSSLTSQFYSEASLVSSSFTHGFTVAVGSAECRPIFSQLVRSTAMVDSFSGANLTEISQSEVSVTEPSWPSWGESWTLSDDAGSSRAQVTRRTPVAEKAGAVAIRAQHADATSTPTITYSTNKTDEKITLVLGAANSTLFIEPHGVDSNIFLDNISVTSWCGNDENRNNTGDPAREMVPNFTDGGFIEDNGFAGTGLWIRPETSDQLAVAPSEYRGEQCLLMQRSRQNTASTLSGETETDGVKHTGSSLALYTPYSNTGFGPVTFRYCIPQMDEYGDSGELPSAYVMLQYRDTPTYSNNYLDGSAVSGTWVNVSAPTELQNTQGEWRTASITPKLDDKELVGKRGTMRLVMVIRSSEDDYDPYVYIDDFMVTDNPEGTFASWSAQNVKITDEPTDLLYWKDRAPNPLAYPEEETFAEKSSLTRAIQFNDTTSGYDTDTTYQSCFLTSPLAPDGVGRVSFAARLTAKDENAKPVRLYILATESDVEADLVTDFTPVTYVEVTNTVYTAYDVDLSKYTTYYTKPKANLLPDSSNSTRTFTASEARRIQLRAYLDGDDVTTDGFGDSSENRKPNPGRVMLDTLSVTAPVLPSLRVESVAFSNVAGRNLPDEFNRQSPLSQPITNAPSLRAMVELGHMQLLRDETIRVFITLNPHKVGESSIKKYSSGYDYSDVFGNEISASSDMPVYAWDSNDYNKWPLEEWFDLDDALAAWQTINPGTSTTMTPEELKLAGLEYTVELTREDADSNYFFGDLSSFDVKNLPANSLVQYTAWAVYQSEESDQWYATQITPSTHTDFPWYFPRNLNLEIQAQVANAAYQDALAADPTNLELESLTDADILVKYGPGASFFSPYYWVYSCLPGEVFINEFNLLDSSGVKNNVRSFVELCAPSGLDIGEWRVDVSRAGTELYGRMRWPIPAATVLDSPAPGAVPAKREVNTSAERSFYTVFDNTSAVFYTEMVNNETTKVPGFIEKTKNAGIAATGWEVTLESNTAAVIQLARPTGGAEHIVIFPTSRQSGITLPVNADSLKKVDELYDIYRNAYISKGFGSEWYQTFLEGSWENYIDPNAPGTFGEIALLEKNLTQAQAHGRRLTKANFFPSAGTSTNNRFDQDVQTFLPVQDVSTTSYANSIATIDMGGMWVTRLNAVDSAEVGGPLDLTELYGDTWTGDNPVYVSRANEREPDSRPVGAVAPFTQVTPRQINLDQYLLKYAGLAKSVVVSEIGGNLLGTHELKLDTDEVRYAGRVSPQSWSLNLSVKAVQLTYKALPFQQVETVTARLLDATSGEAEMVLDKIKAQLPTCTVTSTEPDADGWVTLEVPAATTTFHLNATLLKAGSQNQEDRYNLEAKATFSLNPDSSAADVITHVAPYCGGSLGGSATSQPWWGSGFGFEVTYKDAAAEGAVLTGVIVTYPSPAGLKEQAWEGFRSKWAGMSLTYTDSVNGVTQTPETVSLVGMEYDTAIDLLKNVFGPKAQTRFVEMKGAADGRLADMSLVGILSDTYAKAAGYDEADPATYTKKEPAIPFCVWGVYSASIQTASGAEKVSFLMPQATPAEMPGIFKYPSWYQPLEDLNTGKSAEETVPYFYLYSTPPQAAWLNEVNVHTGGTGSNPYVEVVMPKLREGILNANPAVPQTTNAGWNVSRYTETGAFAGTLALNTTPADSLSSSYTYNSMDISTIAPTERSASAYVLTRPCGAAEGGVWIGVSDDGNDDVAVPTVTENTWLTEKDCYVVPGKTDATTGAGSVQLVGETVFNHGLYSISSAVADRTKWVFAAESKNSANGDEDIPPDTMPEWSQVTLISSLRNTVYGGVLCGYQVVPGFINTTELIGEPSTGGPVVCTYPGPDWVYDSALGNTKVLSYRPRTNYRFESISLPPELIGQVMLIGADGVLSPETVARQVADLKNRPEAEWIRLGGPDINGIYRAEAEYTTYKDENGVDITAPTGVIRFNPEYVVSAPGDEEVTFGDQSNYVITLVLVKEPASAQNRIEVAMGQGEVLSGAWLVSQTLWAKDETGEPDLEKGGDTVKKPIWSDVDGNVDNAHANTLGWLHQPIVGDKLGMSAVINPELGLTGGRLGQTVEDVRNRFESPNATLRPFLVWTLIPKEKVPMDIFTGTEGSESSDVALSFFNNWALSKWIGGSPTVGDRNDISLSQLREDLLKKKNAASGFFTDAGIIPMTWNGFCAADRTLQTDPSIDRATSTLLAFSTMTKAQLDVAIFNADATGITNSDTTLLPYTYEIDMSNEDLWTDGAILRFAIVIADTADRGGRIYDCQELANFTSEELPVYCPWYLPDATANVNRITSTRNAGISPFAWVYAIPRGGVWLNEVRPFATYDMTNVEDGAEPPVLIPSAIELAMFASPLKNEVDANGNYLPDEYDNYLPKYSLDGWKLVMKSAPLDPFADPETPLAWDVRDMVDLKSWVPSRRLKPAGPDDDPAFHDLDYYVATADDSATFLQNGFFGNIATYGYPGGTNATLNNFKWFKLEKELFERDLEATLLATEKYAGKGVVYAIALMRNNGVVVDEVLFYNSTSALDNSTIPAVESAIVSENVNYQVVGEVRGVLHTTVPTSSGGESSAQFVRTTDVNTGTELYGWVVESRNGYLNTFLGANYWGAYLQPQLDFNPKAGSTTALLTARILGSDANLSLAQAYGYPLVGTTLEARYATGTPYTLSLSEWKTDWFTLQSIMKDGRDITSAMTLGTTYALDSAGLLSTTQSLLVDEAVLTGNTDYAISFIYTPAAAKLVAAGDLNSVDDGFLDWLLRVDPNAVLKQTETDGVTAAEKYWLGLDSAAIDATDVKLAITEIGTHIEPTETLPTITVSLTKGEEPIKELTGDGILILLGKETMDSDWQYIRRLYPDDVNGENTLILRTPCTLFKALLLSEAQVEDYKD